MAQGFNVSLNKNIGSTQVTEQALLAGQLDMYPESVGTFNTDVAHDPSVYASVDAYAAGQSYALAHGLRLLAPTPFSDTDAIAVPATYGAQHHLRVISDLSRVQTSLTLGGPPQFVDSQTGLLGIESTYGVTPAHVEPLAIGLQYQALQAGTVQAADVFTTDGELASGQYQLLGDPDHLFGFENVVPVVTQGTLLAEGPAFTQIINGVSALLTTENMRQLNADGYRAARTGSPAPRQVQPPFRPDVSPGNGGPPRQMWPPEPRAAARRGRSPRSRTPTGRRPR